VLHWDGATWTIVSTPAGSTAALYGVKAIATNDVWAVGNLKAQTLTMHWDGISWSIIPSPNVGQGSNILRSVDASGSDDVWAVGQSGQVGQLSSLALHWDGTAWSSVPTARESDDMFSSVAIHSTDDVWAVGAVDGQPLAERWNGTAWKVSPLPTVEPDAALHSICVTRTGTLWSGGAQGADQLFFERTR